MSKALGLLSEVVNFDTFSLGKHFQSKHFSLWMLNLIESNIVIVHTTFFISYTDLNVAAVITIGF